jgi:hypothetical protein
VGTEPFQGLGTDSPDVDEIIHLAKPTVLIPPRHDALGHGRADPGEKHEVLLPRRIEIHPTLDEERVSIPAAAV